MAERDATGRRFHRSVSYQIGTISPECSCWTRSTADSQYDLDQINIGPLPVSLSGKGSVSIVITADGQAAHTSHVIVQ